MERLEDDSLHDNLPDLPRLLEHHIKLSAPGMSHPVGGSFCWIKLILRTDRTASRALDSQDQSLDCGS